MLQTGEQPSSKNLRKRKKWSEEEEKGAARTDTMPQVARKIAGYQVTSGRTTSNPVASSSGPKLPFSSRFALARAGIGPFVTLTVAASPVRSTCPLSPGSLGD
jgi:hypothetical protein